jgi:hypothetical protein
MNQILLSGLSVGSGGSEMTAQIQEERLEERRVTYTLLKDDRLYVIENVPARVNVDTGEQYFAPETVEQLQRIIWEQPEPVRVIEAPVFKFAA